jgi:DNA-binding NtrC family response regulator
MEYAVEYPWKGNIRELENFAKYISVVVASDVIVPGDLSAYLVKDQPEILALAGVAGEEKRLAVIDAAPSTSPSFDGQSWEEIERSYALYLLEKHRWHITRAAKEAGVNRSTFDARLKRLGISKAHSARSNG